MRIAYLINQYPKVSHSFIRREILALEKLGCHVVRISIRGSDLELVDPADLEERSRTRYVLKSGAFPLAIALIRTLACRPRRLFRSLLLARQMAKQSDRGLLYHLAYVIEASLILAWLKENNIEHLHAHFGTNSAEVAMQAHVLGGPPWSFTVHGPDDFDRRSVLGLEEKIRRCAFVVGISSFGRAQLYRLAEQSWWPKVQVIHCGIDAKFEALPAADPTISRQFVCVGRLHEQKGQFLLLQAARILRDRGHDFTLVLAGGGELRLPLQGYIDSNGLGNIVRITGWISESEVRRELERSRALVLPSFAEGLPVVIMEAMASKRPVISTFIAGIPELVRDLKDGWLIPAGDIDALVEAMEGCLAAPDMTIRAMGESARARVLSRHSIEKEAAKLLALFKQISVSKNSDCS